MIHHELFPRILVSSASYSTDNGQGVFTVNLCEGLASRNLTIASLIASPNGNAYQEIRNGVHMYYVESLSVDFIRKDEHYPLFPIMSIKKAFDEFQPNVVHLNDHYPLSFLVYFEAKRRGLQVIGTNHFLPENLAPFLPIYHFAPQFVSWVLWRWMLFLYNRFNLVTTQSKTAAEIVKRAGLIPPVVTVSCGVDTQQFHPDESIDRTEIRKRYSIDPACTVFLYVGRLDAEKRLDSIIDAIDLLNRDDIQLVIAGKGKESQKLQARVNSSGKPERVIFPGFIAQSELNALLNCVDCFIMPSDAELLSIATLEAMSCGLPILAARAYALRELVTDGENGYLFTSREPMDIADKMNQIADHPETWNAMRRVSLIKARGHDMEAVMTRYVHLYQWVNEIRLQKRLQLKQTDHKIIN
jgi:1,2-diacylglycerol 3-alpha-glucosyltransferase